MRILYFLSALVLAVVLIVGCTGDPKGVVDPVQKTGLVPPPPEEPDLDECESNPCGSGSECVDLLHGYQCEDSDTGDIIVHQCNPGWTGTYCHIPEATDPCNPNPCQYGGQCADNGDGSYTCTCAPGFTGDNCEYDIDECSANPCVHGDCEDRVNAYFCYCEPGWTGTNCDVQEVTDADGDGVDDNADQCAGTVSGDVVDATGCSIAQYCPCDNGWKNHGAYVSCVAHSANDFVGAGLITETEKGDIVSEAAQSDCGKKKGGTTR
ncbi:hypothetical protein EDS67_11925 [candidate division KSB1 bacterium]|nr:MAG: hypothetical protein EDS67_11925 [candidate division KSB1 bacterium]MBC6948419.1 hypothetical protein [candidate division KSB1 bacterium]MCE7942232.1 hypothetical protein [Chlorobi bacterium CHB1]MDL1874333.1 calcium-binding EGF-like domain-containing protein [Cytophagia bacterium CHB2]